MRIGDFAERVWQYCQLTHGSVTSWVRSAKRNAEVGGVPDSQHLRGTGADIAYDAPLPLGVRASAAEQVGLQLISERTHDHLQAHRKKS